MWINITILANIVVSVTLFVTTFIVNGRVSVQHFRVVKVSRLSTEQKLCSVFGAWENCCLSWSDKPKWNSCKYCCQLEALHKHFRKNSHHWLIEKACCFYMIIHDYILPNSLKKRLEQFCLILLILWTLLYLTIIFSDHSNII